MNRNPLDEKVAGSVPCPRCFAWAGEWCRTLYTKCPGKHSVGEATHDLHQSRWSLFRVFQTHRADREISELWKPELRMYVKRGESLPRPEIVHEINAVLSPEILARPKDVWIAVQFPVSEVRIKRKVLPTPVWPTGFPLVACVPPRPVRFRT